MNKNTKILLVIIAIAVFLYFRGKKQPTYPTGLEINPSSEDDSYNAGYIEGYNEGYDEGNDDGYNEGYDEGNDDGYNEGYNEGNGDYGFGESRDQISFTTDDVAANVQTENWSDPTFPANPGQSSGRAASRTSIVNAYSKARRGSGSTGTLQNKVRR